MHVSVVRDLNWESIADSFGCQDMSRKAAPKPEELIQKLDEKFNSFKVLREKLKQMGFGKDDEILIMTGGG